MARGMGSNNDEMLAPSVRAQKMKYGPLQLNSRVIPPTKREFNLLQKIGTSLTESGYKPDEDKLQILTWWRMTGFEALNIHYRQLHDKANPREIYLEKIEERAERMREVPRARLNFDLKVFRGLVLPELPKEGETWQDMGYQSSSLRRWVAKEMMGKYQHVFLEEHRKGTPALLEIEIPKGRPLIPLYWALHLHPVMSGRYRVDKLAMNELEILLGPETRLEILKVSDPFKDGHVNIKARVI